MGRTLEELYAEVRRLPPERQRELLARLRRDLAAPAAGAAPATGPAARKLEPRRTPAPAPERTRRPALREAPLLIDGCNLLGAVPDFDLGSQEDHDRLVFLLQDYAQLHPRLRIVLFLDGKRVRRYQHGAVQVRTVAGRPADDSLIEFLQGLSAHDRRRTRVVTADGDLGRRARALGAKLEAPLPFYKRLARADTEPDERDRALSPAEVREWEAYFAEPRGKQE